VVCNGSSKSYISLVSESEPSLPPNLLHTSSLARNILFMLHAFTLTYTTMFFSIGQPFIHRLRIFVSIINLKFTGNIP
jgi:hypothetical protein